ncbi:OLIGOPEPTIDE TRANSPORTER YGL114W-RELATED [Salix purpurea]|uniref:OLIGOPEPTIDE TRANSPORTER YGL114W-RELATED n=1 Tax=Salix purpurea TaxID=77065 RepID=A0A9Q0ZVN5_SALPP|nr:OLIGOPEPTIDE TRANSPORTER YGL114W-RELATED [Salix purpurea]
MNMNMEEMKEIERADGEDTEEVRDEPEDIKRIAPWTKQTTARGIVASVAIGIIYSVIVMKLNLTTGLVPNLNVFAALLAFVFLRTWIKLLSKAGIVTSPFTRQENIIVQTCAIACYSIVVGGGFGSYLLGLNRKTYEQAGVDTEGNTPGSTKEPGIGWMTEDKERVLDDQKRNEIFLREGIPLWVACLGYITFSIISIIAIPLMFPELKWYYVVVAYILAPSLSFCNAYGAGLIDMNMAYNYGKVALFLLAAMEALLRFFAFAILANLSRDLSPKNIGKYVPLPMAMAVPFLVGAYFAIDMCLGSLVVFGWHKLNRRKASLMVPAVASGLICGDGLWILPSSILALAKIHPPICMSFQATN